MKLISIRFFVIAIVLVLSFPISCKDGIEYAEYYIVAESFKLDLGTSFRDSISIYLIDNKQNSSSDSITFILNVDERSFHKIPNPYASINGFGAQLFATPPIQTARFLESISDIKISSSDTIRTKSDVYLPQTELNELFYVQSRFEYPFYSIADFPPKENMYYSNYMELTTYLIFKDSINPIVNHQFTFKILMSDSAEFTVTSPFINIE